MKKQPDKRKITALYERLSHDDERAGESVSIENQKRILEDYAQKNGFTNIRHFTDDGVRGTTFKRPGLDAMLEEIRAGNVATVIIKDQSRIGRDVVEVGLLKRTFDEYHVRFIAANDNLDTANGFDIMSIFRDVINEWYVADTSRKIKTVFKSRMEKGLRCSGSVSYSYKDGQLEKQQPEATPESLMTGETVRTPRGNFCITDMSREQIEAAGFGFHHASEDGKYLIMGNGTQAYAIAAEQPQRDNPLKHVEDIVEQNDNNFDGIINNTPQTPTIADLEQRAKAGEAISVTDLAKAVKAEKREQPQKKPSILKKLDEYKKQAAPQPKDKQKEQKKDLEV